MKMRQGGFSLIELIVVLVITASLLGLVAPLAINQISKTQDHVELLDFKRALKTVSVKAYYSGQPITLELDDKQLRVHAASGLSSIDFQALSFPSQTLYFNANGVANQTSVEVRYKGNMIRVGVRDDQAG